MTHKKLILASLFLFLVLIFGGLFYMKNSHFFRTLNWRNYTSEEYGIQFKYPSEWGNLEFRFYSPLDDVYILKPENEKFDLIFYHQPSGVIAFIERGEQYKLAFGEEEKENYQEILKIIGQDKKIKTLYTIPPQNVEWGGKIIDVSISPNGKYVFLGKVGYESYTPLIFNIQTGKNIIENLPIWFRDLKESVYWSPNNRVLVIQSILNEFGGEGSNGVFVSDYDNPDNLNRVLYLSPEEVRDGGMWIRQIRFFGDEKLYIKVGGHTETREYLYNTKTKKLTEIK